MLCNFSCGQNIAANFVRLYHIDHSNVDTVFIFVAIRSNVRAADGGCNQIALFPSKFDRMEVLNLILRIHGL